MPTSSEGGSYHRKGEAIRVCFVTHRQDALQALRERCRASPAFKRLLDAAAHDLVRRGRPRPILTGNSPAATWALEHAVNVLSAEHRAFVPIGAVVAWSYLVPKTRTLSGRVCRTLHRVSKLEAVLIACREATPDGFTVRRVLGYRGDIGWRAARQLNRLHGPPSFYLEPEAEEPREEGFDLDPNENEHFRDDQGFYDAAGFLRSFERSEAEGWEDGFATREEAWNRTRFSEWRIPVPTRFFPAPAAEVRNRGLARARPVWHVDHHGASELLRDRDHRQTCRRELTSLEARQQMARVLPDAPLYHADLKVAARNLSKREHLVTLGQRAELVADEAEVLAWAERDVPETILELLEQQVGETSGKAPRGVIAALAQARMEAREHAEHNRRHVRGMAALERAASQVG